MIDFWLFPRGGMAWWEWLGVQMVWMTCALILCITVPLAMLWVEGVKGRNWIAEEFVERWKRP